MPHSAQALPISRECSPGASCEAWGKLWAKFEGCEAVLHHLAVAWWMWAWKSPRPVDLSQPVTPTCVENALTVMVHCKSNGGQAMAATLHAS